MRHSTYISTLFITGCLLFYPNLAATEQTSHHLQNHDDIFTTGVVTRLAGEYYLQTPNGRLKMQGVSPSVIQHYVGDTVSIKGHPQYNYVDVYEISVARHNGTEVVFDWYAIDADVYNE